MPLTAVTRPPRAGPIERQRRSWYSFGSTTSSDYATVAYDASTGTELWVTRYNGPGNGDDYAAYALGMSPDGSAVFVTGYSRGSTSGFDYATVAYDATTGAELWASRYNGAADGDIARRPSWDRHDPLRHLERIARRIAP